MQSHIQRCFVPHLPRNFIKCATAALIVIALERIEVNLHFSSTAECSIDIVLSRAISSPY